MRYVKSIYNMRGLQQNQQIPQKVAKRISRYESALASAPHLLEELRDAAEESLSLRDEISVARTILGESIRSLGRATAMNDGVMPAGLGQLVLSQMREVNSLIGSCAAIEAKRQDQQLDAAKLILLLGRLRDDLRQSLREAGMSGAVPFIDAAFERARWTGQLDDAAVQEALSAPASFDVKFRPIERDEQGKLLEHSTAYDTPQEALDGRDLDLTARSKKMSDARDPAKKAAADTRTPLQKVEDEKLKAELAQANDMLDLEIDQATKEAAEDGKPLPGMGEARSSRLDKNTRRLLEERG